uniref:Ribonuclease H-like domain-containing protein n=1 Tax=Tanacetum cinerariifolium TaxID=118510 RepID=A0A699GGY5_TANCI|nr:ribonuclease H-like domain-containing protein [Tanacetum cinerariifolium]
MPSMKEELDQSITPPLCKTSCGFYVNKETGGFCSSCYKADVLKKKASSKVPKIPDVNNNVDNQKPVENHHQSNKVVKKRNRCHVCSKRVGLVPFCVGVVKEVNRVSLESQKDYLCFKVSSNILLIHVYVGVKVNNGLLFGFIRSPGGAERVFTVSSARRFIDDGICVLDGSPTKWLNLILIKINILAWRVDLNKLPTRFNMSLRGMEVSTMKCPVCRVGNETFDHLFFSCSLASAMISRLFKWWELSDMVFQSYHDWENWLNNNVDNQRPVENHHQSNKVDKKKNHCRACNKRISEIYKIISRRRNFSHGLQKQSSVITDKADNIVVVMDLIVLTKGLGNLGLLIFEGFLGSIDCLFVIMSLHGYSDGDEYDNESDVDNVTLIYKLDVSNPLHLHPNDFYHMLNALWKQFDALIELPRCTCHAADDFKKHNQLMKIMQFIMCLEDTYMQIRSSILSRETLFDVWSAYAIISSEESYRIATVSHPNGTEAFITKIGNMPLTDYLTLFDVLVVPEYCVSLMSIHKVARDSKLVISFYDLKCYILNQDLKAGEVLGTGRSDPSFSRYVTSSSHSGSTFDTHNKNEGWHYLGSDAAARENDRQLRLVLSTEGKENYLECPIPVAPVTQPGHQVPLEALTTHAAWIKGKRKLMCLCY